MNKILILSFWNPTENSPKKGIFIQEHVKAIELIRTDLFFLKVNILYSKKLFYTTSEQDNSGRNIRIALNVYSLFWKFIFHFPFISFLIITKFLKKEYPSLKTPLIHSNVVFPCGVTGLLLAKKYRATHMITEHWSKVSEMSKKPLIGKQIRNAYSNSKIVFAVSNFLADKIIGAAPDSRVRILPNIIDDQLFHFREKQTGEPTVLNFLCIAVWEYPKRLDLIIESLIVVSRRMPEKQFYLHVVGDGSQKESYLKQIFVGPDNLSINWLGFVEKRNIPAILERTDFFLHASEIETFSIVTVEALSTGTPVLASRTGALPELIDNSKGVLVNNTISEWVAGLELLIKTQYNHKEIAQSFAGRYSYQEVGSKINHVYNELIAENLPDSIPH